ncbi:MarR family transcriptional regulator [Clostridium sp. C8-1-8]|uniref:MarR family winged helix-turn-helix transcriptional regulator n=1 Tax=Clostridium sp. C8-1-8 TaxID=2698831 RepID=UPI00136E3AA2|nr:MarR family transcriptional regulator [Clostridium sp. C8-1-8]
MNNELSDPQYKELHKVMIRLFRLHRKVAHEQFNKIGLSEGQPKVLQYLVSNDGCIQREIANNCHIEPATVTSLLASMEKAELIYRVQNPEDRRILNVFLTDKGRDKEEQLKKIFKELDNKCFRGFTEEDLVQAKDIFIRLTDNLLGKEKE